MKKILVSLLILLLPFVIFSQSEDYIVNVRHFTKDDGLKNNYISSLYKDSQGLVWVGTGEGLNRFDGRNFKWYDNKTAIGNGAIRDIEEDKNGKLWVLSSYKAKLEIHLIDLQTDKIIPFKEYCTSDSLRNISFSQLYVNSRKDIFLLTTDNILYEFSEAKELIKVYEFDDDFLEIAHIDNDRNIFFSLFLLSNDQVSVNRLNSEGVIREIQTFNNIVTARFLDKNDTNKIHLYSQDRQDNHYVYEISQGDSLKQLLKKPLGLFGGTLQYRVSDSLFIVATSSEIRVMNKEGETILLENNEDIDFPIRSQVDNSFLDEKGNLWLRSFSGFYLVELNRNKFERLIYARSRYANQTVYRSCRGILKDSRGRLFINNYKGGMMIEKGAVSPYPKKTSINYPISIIEDKSNNIWLGQINLLSKLQPNGAIKNYDFRARKKGEIWAMYEAENRYIWMSSIDDITYFDPDKEELTIFTKYNEFRSYFTSGALNYTYQFFKDKQGILWLCTSKGLFILDEKKGLVARYADDVTDTNYYLPQIKFSYMYEDAQGIYWLAHSEGFMRWDKNKGTYKNYTSYNSRHFSDVHSVYEDDFNNLWLSTDDGLLKFDKKTELVTTFYRKDGVTHDEFNRTSSFQAKDGTIYFGSINGVTAFHPRDFTNPKDSSYADIPFTITEFEQYDNKSETIVNKKGEVLKAGQITINPSDKFFKIGFTLTDYINNERISYRYLIEGIDKNWNEIKENYLRISGLPYGKTQLRIQAVFPDGVSAKEEINLPIRVLRPFYRQWWFFVLAGLSIIGIFRWRILILNRQKIILENLVKARTQQIERDKSIIEHQAEELRKLDRVKSRFFANVSHELRTPLTLILSPISTLSNDETLSVTHQRLLQLTRKNAQQLLQLVNEILDLSKLEAGKLEIDTQPIYLYPLLHRLVTTFESYAEKQGIIYKLDYRVPSDLQLDIDVKKLEKIVNNLLSNAFKYTEGGDSITVKIEENQHQVLVTVKDTGRGIHKSDLPNIFNRYYQSQYLHTTAEGGTGIGLALSAEYARLLKGKLWADSILGEGSTFYFQFPKIEVFISTANEVIENKHPIDAKEVVVGLENVIPTNEASVKNSFSVLLVEDNQDLRTYLESILTEQFKIYTSENGKDALQQLGILLEKGGHAMLPDLIISDVMMPIMDGFEFTNLLRNSKEYKHIPVIMLTARAELTDKLRALRIGVDDYLLKPFEESELFARIDNLIKNSIARFAYIQTIDNGDNNKETVPVSAVIKRWTDEDIQWLKKLEQVSLEHISNGNFTLEELAHKLMVSRTKLFRQVKKLTGLTPNHYLQEIRLKKALELLEGQRYSTVKQVSYAVGWRQPKYFARKFKERFGKTPSSYL